MTRFRVLSVLACLAVAQAAFAQDVRYNFDDTANFASFKTYKWVALKGASEMNPLVDKQIKDTVDAELSKKGLTRSDDDKADLYVGYQAGIGQEKQFTTFDTGWGYGPGWYGRGWYGGGGGMTTGTTTTIYIGQLAIDMYASSPHTLVFRSVASKTIDTEAKPEKQQKNLAKAVTKMFKNYPPEKKKK